MPPVVHQFFARGSECAVRIDAATARDADMIAGAAEAEVRRIERRYSRYRSDSELARINRVAASGGSIEVDAETAGLVVSPGELYGDAGTDFVRIAMVQPDERLALSAGRLRGR